MNMKKRISKLEGIIEPDNPIHEALALAKFCVDVRLCDEEEVSRLTAEFAREGLTMKKILDSIAAAGPAKPMAAQQGDNECAVS